MAAGVLWIWTILAHLNEAQWPPCLLGFFFILFSNPYFLPVNKNGPWQWILLIIWGIFISYLGTVLGAIRFQDYLDTKAQSYASKTWMLNSSIITLFSRSMSTDADWRQMQQNWEFTRLPFNRHEVAKEIGVCTVQLLVFFMSNGCFKAQLSRPSKLKRRASI